MRPGDGQKKNPPVRAGRTSSHKGQRSTGLLPGLTDTKQKRVTGSGVSVARLKHGRQCDRSPHGHCAASVLAVCPGCACLVTVNDNAVECVAKHEAGELCHPEMQNGPPRIDVAARTKRCGNQAVTGLPCQFSCGLLLTAGRLAGLDWKKSTLRASTAMRSLSTRIM